MKSMLAEHKIDLLPGVLPFSLDPELRAMAHPLFVQKDAMGQMCIRDSVVAAVEIVDLGNAGLGRRLAEGVENLPGQPHILDPPLAALAVMRVGAADVVLRALEIGQHVVPSPAGIAELAPIVVIARLPPHVDHAVD